MKHAANGEFQNTERRSALCTFFISRILKLQLSEYRVKQTLNETKEKIPAEGKTSLGLGAEEASIHPKNAATRRVYKL